MNITSLDVRRKLHSDIARTRAGIKQSGVLLDLVKEVADVIPELGKEHWEEHTVVAFEIVEFEIKQRRERLAFLLSVQMTHYPSDYAHDTSGECGH